MASKIFIIGAGNIGSRHVQSLVYSSSEMDVYVVDINKENLDNTKNLFFKNNTKNKKNINITFNQSITKIDSPIDIAIISTTSDVRKKVIEELVSLNNVKNIILEKVAFQNMKDFDFIINLLNKKKIKSFINFPRRAFQSYQNLRKKIINEKKIYISNIGTNWNLSSNSLHMMDLLTYFTEAKKIFVEEVSLKKEVYGSSNGFVEFKGALKFSTDRGDTLYLHDDYEDDCKIKLGVIRIENKNFSYSIYENYKKIVQAEFKKDFFNVGTFNTELQSALTCNIVDDLLINNRSCLTNLEDSYYHHKILLEIFTKHIRECGLNISGCPIT